MATEEFNTFQSLFREGRLTEALKLAEQQCLGQQNAFWLTQQAKVLIKQRKYAQGLSRAEQALSLDAVNAYAILAAADALFGLKKYDEAAGYYLEAAGTEKLAGIADKKYLECLVKLKKWETLLEFITKTNIAAAEIFSFKIQAYIHLGKDEDALQSCRQWLKAKPDYPPAVRQLIELEIKRDGVEKVTANLARMMQIPSLAPIYREIYATLCERTGNREAARRQLETLQSTRAGDPWMQKRNAYHLARTGHEEEAIPLLEELLRLEPEEIYLHTCYAAACRRIGKLEQALNFYQQLAVVNPGAKSLYGRIGKIKKQLGHS